jgi:hypothetical protein
VHGRGGAEGAEQIVSFLAGFSAQSLQLAFAIFAGLTLVLALVRVPLPYTHTICVYSCCAVGRRPAVADVQQTPGTVGADEGDEEDAVMAVSRAAFLSFFLSFFFSLPVCLL